MCDKVLQSSAQKANSKLRDPFLKILVSSWSLECDSHSLKKTKKMMIGFMQKGSN